MMKFNLQIKMGNEKMMMPHDVYEALKSIVEIVRFAHLDDKTKFIIKDANGNTVGDWSFTNE
jgi:hypothetical protein